jgi:hypothetical protein
MLALTQQSRPFPGEQFWELVETWAQQPPYSMSTLLEALVSAEAVGAVDSELAAL